MSVRESALWVLASAALVGATSVGLASATAATGPTAYAAVVRGLAQQGDYSFAVLDTSADAVWLATEYVPPTSSQTSTREANWGTRVFEVALH